MKAPFLPNNYLSWLAISAVGALVFACETTPTTPGGHSGKVEITDVGIVLHPTVTLSPKTEQDLSAILGRYKKSLYRIASLKDGKVVQDRGTASIADVVKPELTLAQQKGRSVHSHNFVCPAAAGCPPQKILPAGRKLVAELSPILKEYR